MGLEAEELRSAEDALEWSEVMVEDLQGECVEYREVADAHETVKRRLDLVEGRLAHNEWVASRAVEQEIETRAYAAELSAVCREQERRLARGSEDLEVLERKAAALSACLWGDPAVLALRERWLDAGGRAVEFGQCAYGADARKPTRGVYPR